MEFRCKTEHRRKLLYIPLLLLLQDLWKQRLIYRFQNGRKREHKDIPETALRKRIKKSTPAPDNTSTRIVSTPIWGIPRYLPDREPGEDDLTISEHINALKLEKSKKRPNYERVCLLMSKTLSERRKKIVTEGISIPDLKKDYPWLFDEEEVCNNNSLIVFR